MNKILKRDVVYQGRICSLTHNEVEFADGSKGYRDILHLPGAVAILAFKDENTLLLVEQYRHAVNETLLEIPAGMLEKGEGKAEAALRELQEETGYHADKLEYLTSFYTSPGVVQETLYIYVAHDLHYVGQHLDDDEFLNVREVSTADFQQLILDDKIKDGKSVLAYTYWKLNH